MHIILANIGLKLFMNQRMLLMFILLAGLSDTHSSIYPPKVKYVIGIFLQV